MSKPAAGASLFVVITVGVGSHPPGRTGDQQYQIINLLDNLVLFERQSVGSSTAAK